jgi:hypothetical protein
VAEGTGVGETGSVITDLGEHSCTGQVGQSGEADDDRGVGVLVKGMASGLGEVLVSLAGGVELQQQALGLVAERSLDHGELMQVLLAQDGLKLLGTCVQVALAAGTAQRRPQLGFGELGSPGGGGAAVRTARASAQVKPTFLTWKALSAAGKNSRSSERSGLASCWRFQTASRWARAGTAMDCTSSESSGRGR